jgi:hypothetical protein
MAGKRRNEEQLKECERQLNLFRERERERARERGRE